MGMFDSVYAGCPTCGKPMEFQSKEGECYLHNYSVDTAPTEVLRDVLNDPHYCRHCDSWAVLFDPDFPPNPPPPPRPSPAIRKVRQPTSPLINKWQPETRWWDEPFTEADILPAE